MKIWKSLLFVLGIFMLSAVVSAQNLPLTINEVQVNDVEVVQGSTNRLDVLRDGTFEVEVQLTPTADINDLELQASLFGHEYNDFEPITATAPIFDADANVTYVKRLVLRLSDKVEEDNYRLRLIFGDRNSNLFIVEYNLKVDVDRHVLSVEDVVMYPSGQVEAGRALLTTVRVENMGEKDEKDVKVTVSVPQLGISASDFIDEVEADEEEEKEEIFLQIPACAEAGSYPVEVTVTYDEGFETFKKSLNVRVSESGSCPLRAAAEKEEGADNDDSDAQNENVQVIVENTVIQAPQPEPVEESQEGSAKSVLEVILIILLVVLVILGVVVGVTKLKEGSDEENEEEV